MRMREMLILAALTSAAVPLRAQEPEKVYFEFQVTKPVTQKPASTGPRFPVEQKAAGINGEVLAQFIVDTAGAPVMDSFKVLRASHGAFVDAIRAWLPTARFVPAEVNGKKVRQLVQQPFIFNISKTDSAAVARPSPDRAPSFSAWKELPVTPAPPSGTVDGWMVVRQMTAMNADGTPAFSMTTHFYGTAQRLRMETTSTMNPVSPAAITVVMLIDSASRQMRTIMPAQRMVMVMRMPDSLPGMARPHASYEDASITDLGAGESIAGRATHHYRSTATARTTVLLGDSSCVIVTPFSTEYWMTDDARFGAAIARMSAMRGFFSGLTAAEPPSPILPATKPAGVMVRTRGKMPNVIPGSAGAEVEYTTDITEASVGPMDASLFEVPEGYRVMDMTGFMTSRTDSASAAALARSREMMLKSIAGSGTRTCTFKKSP